MKLHLQIALTILLTLTLNTLVSLLLTNQPQQIPEQIQVTSDLQLIDSNTTQLLLVNTGTALLLLGSSYFFTRRITRPIARLTRDLQAYDGSQPLTDVPEKGFFKEFRQLRKALRKVARTQKDALKESYHREQELAVTLDSIGDGVITTDAEGRILKMNPVAEQITAWSTNAAQGQPLNRVLPLIDTVTREPIDNPATRVISKGETIHLSNHTTLLTKDGIEHHIADSAAPIRNLDNEVIGMVLVFHDVSEEYRLRERAKAVHEQMQTLLNGLHTTTGILNCDGTLVFTNDTPLKASNIAMSDVIGLKFWDCLWWNYDPQVQELIKSDLGQALAGKTTSRDIQGYSPRGLFWTQLNICPVRDKNGRVIQLVAEGVPIHKRKLMEEELRASTQRLEVYRDQSPLAIIEWDKVESNGEITGWNKAAEKMFGYTFSEARGKSPQFLAPPELDLKLDQHISGLYTRSGSESLVSKNLTKDGRIIYCQWYNTPLFDEAANLVGCGSILRDITTEREAKAALTKSAAEQRDILSSMLEAVITVDESSTILTFNKAAEKLFGYSANEIIERKVEQLLPAPHSSAFSQYMTKYLQTGDSSIIGSGTEILAVRKNGDLFPTRLAVAELSVVKGGKRRFIATCQDLSQIKQREEQLRRSQKMDALGKLTSGIAHDFNNMLGVVSGYSELLQSALSQQPKLEKYAREITHAGQRGAKLTQRLLTFARNEANPTTELIDLNAILRDQQHMLGKTLTPRIALVMGLSDTLWPVSVDSSELEDAILNMCINAMHAMEGSEHCQLSIRTRNEEIGTIDGQALQLPPGDYVLASITDTGCGMSNEILEQVFDPFFSTKGTMGTGLGLSQVYGFVKQSGGAIKVYSELDQGTQFVFYFPRAQTIEHGQNDSTPTEQPQSKCHATLLVVDDEIALLALNEAILSQQGYRVITADSGPEALKILARESIDLLISDVLMPGMDGCQLLAIVHEEYPQVITQLASGFTGDHHSDEIIDRHPQDILHKPYSAKTLLQRVAELLTVERDCELS
ncbi:hypothetical protein A9Q90_04675 [Gammaproteobacteria bacterium 54_18_T64]|nr:hypothetical protein A9Q90_04675 [Gammaproteobacteria bacterium 54_18_T64]